jgi:UDP-N-acetylmuramoylalanine--D-glutamate ligase
VKIVIGLGKTGVSCINYLLNKGEIVVVMDSRDDPPGLSEMALKFPQLKIMTGGFDLNTLLQADEVIVSPGLSLKTPEIAAAIEQGIPCVGDIELFAREAQAPIIAITGSNGKTTLTTLMGQLLQDAGHHVEVCGNIGTPVLDILTNDVPDYYVMELSSFQLETTHSLRAKVATVLNITPDHMDRYDLVDDYAAAKLRIYKNCECAVINSDEPYTYNIDVKQQISFSTQNQKSDFYLKESHVFHGSESLFALDELACQGRHHYENALAALAIGTYLGVPLDSIRHTLSSFTGLAHRCQKIASAKGIDWYNDSKATNIGATTAALNTLKPIYKDIVLIAGGDAKGADLSDLGPIAGQLTSHVILMGASAGDLEGIMQGHVATTRVDDLQEAVKMADTYADSETAVLLSPACASWDMFANYEERGNLFIIAVKEFIDAKGSSS